MEHLRSKSSNDIHHRAVKIYLEAIYESNRFVVDFPVTWRVSNNSENVTKYSTLSRNCSMSDMNDVPSGSFPSSPELSVPVVDVSSIPVPCGPRVQAMDHYSGKLSSSQISNSSDIKLFSDIVQPLILGCPDKLVIMKLFHDQWKTKEQVQFLIRPESYKFNYNFTFKQLSVHFVIII